MASDLYSNVCAVIAFPHGNTLPEAKYAEAVAAMDCGAKELDVVVNYGRFLDGGRHDAFWEIAAIVKAARPRGVLVKAILETCFYTPDQLHQACRLCVESGVDFVKTSTGFGPGGATPEAVKTMLVLLRLDGRELQSRRRGRPRRNKRNEPSGGRGGRPVRFR